MRTLLLTIVTLVLAGCGTVPLGTAYAQQGQSVRERDQDILYCKDWAKTQTDTTERTVGSFLAGLTIIGAPFAIASANDRMRELYAQCMSERGYHVDPPT